VAVASVYMVALACLVVERAAPGNPCRAVVGLAVRVWPVDQQNRRSGGPFFWFEATSHHERHGLYVKGPEKNGIEMH